MEKVSPNLTTIFAVKNIEVDMSIAVLNNSEQHLSKNFINFVLYI